MTYNKLSPYATTINGDGLDTIITYHSTQIVKFNSEWIVLDSGGWETVTTKRKMNQASMQFNLGYQVYQIDFKWYVDYKGSTLEYYDGMKITR